LAGNADAAARLAVAQQCDSLLSRPNISTFDESLGAADYARWRRDLLDMAASIHIAFKATLLTQQNFALGAVYNDADVLLDTAAGVPAQTIPQMRQVALLQKIRASLQVSGAARKLILNCRHAGGVATDPAGIIHDQALIILDRRWAGGELEPDVGGEAQELYSMKWPAELSVNAYNSYFNSALAKAGAVGQNPTNDIAQSILLRKAWWPVIASPPISSIYYEAAREARLVTRQQQDTIAHRVAFHLAITEAIKGQVKAGVGSSGSAGGVGRGSVHARFGGIAPEEVLPPNPVHPFAFAASPNFPGARSRRCPRCALLAPTAEYPQGAPVMHPATHRCEAACVCLVCNSDRHLKHACFIAQGVPKMVKLSADMMVELRRLHDLYTAGKFDWKSTTTTLKWMNAM
jgi:hypothetical protein